MSGPTLLPAADSPDDETICYCIGVSRGQILTAMRNGGAKSLSEVVRATKAMGGCMTCRFDIELAIEQELARQSNADAEG